jgi:hypothetical protein
MTTASNLFASQQKTIKTKQDEHGSVLKAYPKDLEKTDKKDTVLCNSILSMIETNASLNPSEQGFRYYIEHCCEPLEPDCTCQLFKHDERRQRIVKFFTDRGFKISQRECHADFCHPSECCGEFYICWNPGYQGDFYTDGIANPVIEVIPDPPPIKEPEPEPVAVGP